MGMARRSGWVRLGGAAVVAVIAMAMAPQTRATPICPTVFVPAGYEERCHATDRVEWELEVTPRPPELSKLTIRPVAEDEVFEPFVWLQEQLVLDMNGLRAAFEDMLDHPENPFAGLIPKEALEPWLEQFGILGQLPLRGCGQPFELVGKDVWQIDCRWSLGPVEQIARLQLVGFGRGDPYLVAIWTTDQQRFRHLQAIANSLEWSA